jgi:succinoglycan biosynthesis transport protein ExoP
MNKPSSLPTALAAVRNWRADPSAASAAPVVPNAPTHLARTLLARKGLFLAGTVALAVPAVLWILALTPIYAATAVVLIEASRSKVVSIEEMYAGASANREHFQTQAEFLKSRDVSLRVVRELDLTRHPAFAPTGRGPTWLGDALSALGATRDATPTPAPGGDDARAAPDREAAVLAQLQRGLAVEPVRLSQLVRIGFESPDRVLAARIANAIAEAYIRADLDARLRMTQTASTWLSEQLDQLRHKLEASERRLQAYRDSAGIVSSRGSAEGGNARQLEELSQRLVQARVARSQVEQVYSQLRAGTADRMNVPAVFNNPSVVRAREAEGAAQRKLAEVRQRVGASHPAYLSAVAELEAARADHQRQADAVVSSVEREHEVAKGTERALEAGIARSRGQIQDINRKQVELDTLEREAATDRQLYQTFLARVKETSATADFHTPVARIVDPAIEPTRPSKPPKGQLVAVALLSSLLLSGALTIWWDRRRTVVRASDDVEPMLGVPLLAAVPKVARPERGRLGRAVAEDRHSLFAESVRTTLTGVQLSLLDVPCPIVAFASTVPGEGKSTLAVNFAIEQARTRRVLLVDADLRRPSVARLLELPGEAPGFTDLLRGEPSGRCVRHLAELSLHVLGAGPLPENPLDLLTNPRLAQSLDALRGPFDLIVLDTPPIELVSDALLLARHVDGVVYVVKAADTPVSMIRRGLSRLRSAGVPILGVVLNAHDFDRAGRYYGDTSAHTLYDYRQRTAP